ncbi:MAG: hypothetical protein KDD85_09030 [Parvularculaceae bacterium]|nr:hypothetical protein [Parvularculaceae bacterium]
MLALVAKFFPWAGGLFISAIFLDSLRFKFTGHPTPKHIFETLKDWSGVGLFYPAGPWIIGLGELASSVLLVAAPLALLALRARRFADLSQFAGALVALGVMSGAIFFHLFTPLGIETPVEWSNGVATKFSPALFYSACASWACAAVILILRRESISR